MKTIIRNFISIFKRFKMAMSLNVLGLAVAFTAFVVILIQINYEQSFDRCHPTADRVFRVDLESTGTFSVILPRGFIEEVIKSSPHIEAGTLVNPFLDQIYFSTVINGEKVGFREPINTCHPEMIKIFDFPVIEGDKNCLNDPEKIMIPQSMARKMFGRQSAVGQTLRAEENVWTKENIKEFTIGAVYKDFPGNTQVRNIIYSAIDANCDLTNFGASNYYCYLLLDKASSAENVVENFNSIFDFKKIGREEEKIKLVPLTDIYYLNESQDGRIFRSGNTETAKLLFGIALLIMVIAIINYTNFSTALTPMRIKSINTQKVLGSTDSTLRKYLLSEAILVSLLSWLLSLFLLWILNATGALPFVEANLGFATNAGIILMAGLIALATGIIAGVYPSRYMVSFPPALVLKGSFGLSPSGRKLRTALIGVQFVISIMLIIGAGFVRLQNNYLRNYSLGFDKDQIAIVQLSGDIYNKHRDTYSDRLKEFSGIEDVAFAQEKVASKDSYNTNTGKYKEESFQYFLIAGSYNLLPVLGIPIVDGRGFSKADELSEEVVYIFNNTARTNMDMEVGYNFEGWLPGRLVGVTDDVKFTSLRSGQNNIGFVTGKLPIPMTVSYIRMNAGTDVHAAVKHIRKTLADIDPSYPFDIEFYDAIFDQLYQKETNLRSLVTLFSMLAVILSLVGVFGLVVFDTQYRRKEIAIRKVHGSTISQILNMLNKQYVYIVLICFAIAAPIAYYAIGRWLESFAYKTPVHAWVYAVALFFILLITIGTVTFQSWRTANSNPVDSIKSE